MHRFALSNLSAALLMILPCVIYESDLGLTFAMELAVLLPPSALPIILPVVFKSAVLVKSMTEFKYSFFS